MTVQIWRGGDDGLTLRFTDAVDVALQASEFFKVSVGNQPGTMVGLIPSAVRWKRVGPRTRVSYVVEFSTGGNPYGGQPLGVSKSSCWDGELSECAARVVKDALVAARKIH